MMGSFIVCITVVTMPLQWNTVNTVTKMGQKNLALFTSWPYYRGRGKFHDLRTVMTNTPCIRILTSCPTVP